MLSQRDKYLKGLFIAYVVDRYETALNETLVMGNSRPIARWRKSKHKVVIV